MAGVQHVPCLGLFRYLNQVCWMGIGWLGERQHDHLGLLVCDVLKCYFSFEHRAF